MFNFQIHKISLWSCIYSWDWGPAFPSVGIWRPISIEAYDSVTLKYVKWNPYFADGLWSIDVETIFECADPENCENIKGDLTLTMKEVSQDPFVWKDLSLSKISGKIICRSLG